MPTPETKPSRAEWAVFALLVALAAWLRVRHLGDVPFGSDAAHMLQMADRMAAGERILTGIPSSKGLLNPPLAVYLLFLLRLVLHSPRALAAGTAALNVAAVAGTWPLARRWFGPRVAMIATALFAVSAWAVCYSRAIWQQDFIPPLAVGALAATLFWTVEKKPWGLGVALACTGACSQLHLTGFAWFGVLVCCGVALRPPVRLSALAAGLGACALLYLPFVIAIFTMGVGGGKKGPQALFVDPLAGAVRHALGSITHGGITFDLPTLHAALSRRAPLLHPLYDAVPWLAATLGVFGAIIAAPRWREIVRTTDVFRFRLDSSPALLTLFVWSVAPVAAMVVTGLSTAPHYVILLFPGMWILAAIAIERIHPAIAVPLVVLECAFVLTLQSWIATDLTRPGGYGPALAFQEQAIDAIVEIANGSPVAIDTAPEPGVVGTAAITDNYRWLLREAEIRRFGHFITGGPDRREPRRFVLVDLGQGALSPAGQTALEAHHARRFGPLWVAPWP